MRLVSIRSILALVAVILTAVLTTPRAQAQGEVCTSSINWGDEGEEQFFPSFNLDIVQIYDTTSGDIVLESATNPLFYSPALVDPVYPGSQCSFGFDVSYQSGMGTGVNAHQMTVFRRRSLTILDCVHSSAPSTVLRLGNWGSNNWITSVNYPTGSTSLPVFVKIIPLPSAEPLENDLIGSFNKGRAIGLIDINPALPEPTELDISLPFYRVCQQTGVAAAGFLIGISGEEGFNNPFGPAAPSRSASIVGAFYAY